MSLVVRNGKTGHKRTKLSTVRLTCSTGDPVYTVKFNSDGSLLASGGEDRNLTIWDVNSITPEDTEDPSGNGSEIVRPSTVEYKYQPLIHKSAVTWIEWSKISRSLVFTSSADGTAGLIDLTRGQKIKTFHHSGCVNQVAVSKRDMVVTCSDDGKVKTWDVRSKFPTTEITTDYPVLTCCSDADERGLFFSGIDPSVHCYDPRDTKKPLWSELNHSNNVTSLSLSPDSAEYLLSKSVDGTIKYFDSRFTVANTSHRRRARPYVFDGATSTQEDWLIRSQIIKDPNGKLRVVSGSNDGFVYMWDFASRKLVARMEGHTGSSFDIDYNQGRLASCSIDGSLIVREIN
ncbi:DEKNAAC104806 [Brettanomyces naardenensis]|uniref:DEKNAAC104806 n=1 Tax=Brettanomyces naardenensis TaxID=13370 RepID=A0A448YSH3_BRENA|nr:DEKNAAC104806 [Brettanomyces naardenensis]